MNKRDYKTFKSRSGFTICLEDFVGHSLTTFQNTEFCQNERKICTNVSFATVCLVNYS